MKRIRAQRYAIMSGLYTRYRFVHSVWHCHTDYRHYWLSGLWQIICALWCPRHIRFFYIR